jgi:hypothetical protein
MSFHALVVAPTAARIDLHEFRREDMIAEIASKDFINRGDL